MIRRPADVPPLGDGRPVEVTDVARANRLSRQVSAAAAVTCAGLLLAGAARRGRMAR